MKLLPSAARYLQIFLIGLCVVFIISTWLEINHDNTLQANAARTKASSDGSAMVRDNGPKGLPPITHFKSIIERPLFTSDRRRANIESRGIGEIKSVPPVTPGSRVHKDLLLLGIVLDKDEAIALVQSGSDHKIHRLETGDSIADWTVKEIKKREIVLSRGQEIRSLGLQVGKSPATSTFQYRRGRTTTATNAGAATGRQSAKGKVTGQPTHVD